MASSRCDIVGPLSLSSTGGVINIGSLNAGNITNIQVDSLGCNSNTVDVTLTNPTDPTIAVSIVEPSKHSRANVCFGRRPDQHQWFD